MTVGYLIIAHHKPLQLLRLVHAIRAQSEGPIIIHLDRKSLRNFRNVIRDLEAIRHVSTISKRRIAWGQFSIVEAALDCMSALCGEFPHISHIKHLSGQDYLIKPIIAFEQLMMERRGLSSVDIHRLPWTYWSDRGGFERVEYTYFRIGRRFFRFSKRRLPYDVTFYGGSQFWCISREHCRYVLAEADKWRPLFRHSLIPDEMYFHTVLMNSKFADEIINEQITYVRWVGDAASPSLLGLEDLPELIRSRAYFARKFDICQDPRIIEALDQQLANDNARLEPHLGQKISGHFPS
jgi:hypothetical protein